MTHALCCHAAAAKRKGTYDLYGEDGLKDGVMDAQGNVKAGMYTFDPELTPHQVFSRFFGTENPYEALDAISAQFEAMTMSEQPKVGKNKVREGERKKAQETVLIGLNRGINLGSFSC